MCQGHALHELKVCKAGAHHTHLHEGCAVQYGAQLALILIPATAVTLHQTALSMPRPLPAPQKVLSDIDDMG